MPSATKQRDPLEQTRLVIAFRRDHTRKSRQRTRDADLNTRPMTDVEQGEGPVAKKRKLENGGLSVSQALQSQPSFADVLERLKKEEETNATGISETYCFIYQVSLIPQRQKEVLLSGRVPHCQKLTLVEIQ